MASLTKLAKEMRFIERFKAQAAQAALSRGGLDVINRHYQHLRSENIITMDGSARF